MEIGERPVGPDLADSIEVSGVWHSKYTQPGTEMLSYNPRAVRTRTLIAAGVSGGAIALGVLVAWWFGHWTYVDILQTIETFVEVAILVFVVLEGIKVVGQVTDIHDATASTVGITDALPVGSRVHVLIPEPGKTREQWTYSGDIWVIREVDKEKNRAVATPIYPPLNAQGQIPTVSGPITGPHSPFIKANVPG